MLDTRVAPSPYPSTFAPAPAPAPERPRPPAATLGMRGTVVMIVLALASAYGYVGQAPLVPRLNLPGIPAASMLEATPPRPIRAMPAGKGMWIWQYGKTEGGDVAAIVARAKAVGLTHLYLRIGSRWDGFYGGPSSTSCCPPPTAPACWCSAGTSPGWRIVAGDVAAGPGDHQLRDARRHRIDGFSADIETGVGGHPHLTRVGVGLRQADPRGGRARLTLIACVPDPSPRRGTSPTPRSSALRRHRADGLLAQPPARHRRDPRRDELAKFGKPVFPVGQAYDGLPEGGRPGAPPPDELWRFFIAADSKGVTGVSFWSWQAADQRAWDAIRDATEFTSAG